ncbi:MAG: nuclear transport factor 2 family protein [Cytophagaceae bacterium]|nr:nuclear transport factor 2 family protein [Cytophagaceae bacterium]
MQNLLLLLFLLISRTCFSQSIENTDKKEVTNIVQQFFVALEKQDTVIYKSLLFENAQIWVVGKRGDKLKTSVRTFKEDYTRFNPKRIVHEVPLYIDIKIHKDIAIAWVPYELSVNGKFSHCGIDTFTFLKTTEGWKIVNCSYSVEPDGCTAIKNVYPNKNF